MYTETRLLSFRYLRKGNKQKDTDKNLNHNAIKYRSFKPHPKSGKEKKYYDENILAFVFGYF